MQLLAFYYSTQTTIFQSQDPCDQGRNTAQKITSAWHQFGRGFPREHILLGRDFAVAHTELI